MHGFDFLSHLCLGFAFFVKATVRGIFIRAGLWEPDVFMTFLCLLWALSVSDILLVAGMICIYGLGIWQWCIFQPGYVGGMLHDVWVHDTIVGCDQLPFSSTYTRMFISYRRDSG